MKGKRKMDRWRESKKQRDALKTRRKRTIRRLRLRILDCHVAPLQQKERGMKRRREELMEMKLLSSSTPKSTQRERGAGDDDAVMEEAYGCGTRNGRKQVYEG